MSEVLPRLPVELEALVRRQRGHVHPSRADFRRFLRRVLKAVSGGIASQWGEFDEDLTGAAREFINAAADDLAEWSGLLAAGAISAEDFRWLVGGRAATVRMHAIAASGMSANQAGRFRAMLVEGVVRAAADTFLPQR